ncbi:hypothetical protein LOZ51_002554 [Ophidiomyces ophidiicola]|nr:hypothetical protein LOZ55_004467 [Ophidiomyces ophidiicola]KAI1980192.1 hypothetical protein LOZ54_005908 [Ophidiomyces ophidiicola]KAI1997882.1 hypothetical protein LOZ51_002554 [Ophidiomyces ophidiicola]
MRFSIAASAALVAGASAGYVNSNATHIITEVLTAYTTYCPGPTQVVQGGKTYTVTKATTLTITDCPCTVTRPVVTTTQTECKECPPPTGPVPTVPAPSGPAPSGPAPSIPAPVPTGTGVPPPQPPVNPPVNPPTNPPTNPPVYPNGTQPVPPSPPQGTAPGTKPSGPPTFTGAASRVVAGGAGLAGVLALAFLL